MAVKKGARPPKFREPTEAEWLDIRDDYDSTWKGCEVGIYFTAIDPTAAWQAEDVYVRHYDEGIWITLKVVSPAEHMHDVCMRPKGHDGIHITSTGLVCNQQRKEAKNEQSTRRSKRGRDARLHA